MHAQFPLKLLSMVAAVLAVWAAAIAAPAYAQSTGPGGPTVISPESQRPPQDDPYSGQQSYPRQQPYSDQRSRQDYGAPRPQGDPYGPPPRRRRDDTYSPDEILDAGHRFFGRVSSGLAEVIEYAFAKSGRPNGYILGEEAGGAFVAGLRYGEGTLYTRDAGRHKVFWQGPSIGYDFGAEGSKTMILVYDLRNPQDIYGTFGGVDGSAYFIGGIGITYQKRDHVTLAPIRAGVGLRLGANVGYLKYTRRPTWNPF